MTKTQSFNLNEKPELSVTITALTSFSYYKGDGVARDITAANLCEPYKVYAPTIKINGIATEILKNPNYSFVVSNSFNGTLSKNVDGVYSYNDYTVNGYGAYSLTANVTFDGTVRSGAKSVHITGLPYSAMPPTQSDWSGTAAQWNGSYVRLQNKQTITKSFHCPENINVRVEHDVRVHRHTQNTTYELRCGGSTLKSVTGGSIHTNVTDNGSYTGVLSTSNSTVSCYNSFGQSEILGVEGTNTRVNKIRVDYR